MIKTLKYVFKSLLIGFATLLMVNFIGQWFSFHIPINALTIILIGFFHLPGFIVVLIILLL